MLVTDHVPWVRHEADLGRAQLRRRYDEVRAETLARVAPLSPEDQGVQSMPDASPAKWHLAHKTWFFEVMVLLPHAPDYRAQDERYLQLFNSYYESLGPRHPRPQRGMLTRPAHAEVIAYRQRVDSAMAGFIASADADTFACASTLIELGLQHEQQHQELIYTDILHALSLNPLRPTYSAAAPALGPSGDARWLEFAGGEATIGHAEPGFGFDNEGPSHGVRLLPYSLSSALVTNAQYLEFMLEGGYGHPGLSSKQRRSPNGPVPGCPPSSNGKRPCGRQVRRRCTAVSAPSGNGRGRPTTPTRASGPSAELPRNTTASSWSASWCCAAAAMARLSVTAGRATATSSRLRRAGSSAG